MIKTEKELLKTLRSYLTGDIEIKNFDKDGKCIDYDIINVDDDLYFLIVTMNSNKKI